MNVNSELVAHIQSAIRDIPDYPKPGILFKDITPLLQDGKLLQRVVEEMAMRCKAANVEKVIGIESRGFIFGTPLATRLGIGFVPVRKKGKLPAETRSITYSLEYGEDTLEIHADALRKGERVVIIDDLLATGGTAKATCDLVKSLDAEIVELMFLVELTFLNGREKCGDLPITALVQY